ncbi:MAG: ClbS/DfsB family four-helix bundle protein [Magnetococcales bacterium]|nr:ClbS/DfsB family four-helix bundle protein [Magnetococcales bacterium]
MARPKTKQELLDLSQENFDKLKDIINSFSPDEQRKEYIFDNNRDKNIRDIIVHLHEWHLMMMEWYKIGMTGVKPAMPAKGYTWKTIKDLNLEIWKKYQKTGYEEAHNLLDESFQKVQVLITKHTDKELFEKKKYIWTGSTSMGSYFVSATSSHYDWAMKHLKKYKKSLKMK